MPRLGMATALTTSIALATATVHAAPQEDPEAEARRLHRQGQVRFDTADYAGAIESWTQAYAALPDRPESASMRPFILYNIATAREKAYDVYHDVSELRQARELLQRFESEIDELYDDPEEAEQERRRVQERIARLDARIAEHEGTKEPPPKDEPEEPVAEPVTPPTVEPPAPVEPTPLDEPAAAGPDGRLIAGAVLLGVGAAAAAVAFAGIGVGVRANDIDDLSDDDFAGREKRFDRGRAGNVMAIAGGVAAPLLIATGVALVVVAKKRPRSARHARIVADTSGGGIALRF